MSVTFDEAYLHRLREHDPATEEHFISYFSERLNVALKAVDQAKINKEEVRQETFRRVWAAVSQGSLRHPQGFGSFVQGVCQQVLNESRRSDLRPINSDKSDVLSQESGLEEETLRFEQRVLIQRVLEELPERDRRILKARFFEDLDTSALCHEFGVDRDYLRVLIHRAIRNFTELYKKSSS